MSTTNIIFGIAVSLMGIYAIVFNKYPGKQVSLENAKKKYNTVNERRLTLFDGVFCIAYGLAYGFLPLYFLAIMIIAYYPVRIISLKLKFIWSCLFTGTNIYVCPLIFFVNMYWQKIFMEL